MQHRAVQSEQTPSSSQNNLHSPCLPPHTSSELPSLYLLPFKKQTPSPHGHASLFCPFAEPLVPFCLFLPCALSLPQVMLPENTALSQLTGPSTKGPPLRARSTPFRRLSTVCAQKNHSLLPTPVRNSCCPRAVLVVTARSLWKRRCIIRPACLAPT